MDITCAILAGGRSRRMGRDKAWLDAGGVPLIRRVIDRLRDDFRRIVISANGPEYDSLGFARVSDILEVVSPLAGIHAVLRASESQWCLVVGCDMPFISVPLVRHLAERARDREIVVPESPRGLEPLHALYSRACLAAIEEAASARRWGLGAFCRERRSEIVRVDEMEWAVEGRSPFVNVNTPGDLDAFGPGERV